MLTENDGRDGGNGKSTVCFCYRGNRKKIRPSREKRNKFCRFKKKKKGKKKKKKEDNFEAIGIPQLA